MSIRKYMKQNFFTANVLSKHMNLTPVRLRVKIKTFDENGGGLTVYEFVKLCELMQVTDYNVFLNDNLKIQDFKLK